MEDAILSNLVTNEDIPQEIKTGLGSKNGHIINTLVSDLIQQSHREGAICFSEEIFKLYQILIEFNYESIYKHKSLTNYKVFIDRMIRTIYEYLKDQFIKHGFDYDGYKNENIELAKAFGKYLEKMQHIYLKENNLPNQLLSDYLSGMTDGYAIKAMKEICIPNPL